MAVSKKTGSQSAKPAAKKAVRKSAPGQTSATRQKNAPGKASAPRQKSVINMPAASAPEKKKIVNTRKSLLALLFFIILAFILYFAFRRDPMQDIPRMINAAVEDLAAGRHTGAILRLDRADAALEGLRQQYENAEPENEGRRYALVDWQRQANELRKFAELSAGTNAARNIF